MRIATVVLIGTLALAACDGPKEKEGQARDKAEAAASGVPYSGNGPNERLGAAQDKAERAMAKKRDARSDALKEQGREVRSRADVQADKLEEQARAIRNSAKEQANALNAQAATHAN